MLLSQQITQLAAYFIDSNKFYYLLLHRSGTCKYSNPLFLNNLGLNENEVLSLSFTDLLPGDEPIQFRNLSEYCWQHPDKKEEIELTLKAFDEKFFSSKWELSICKDANGDPVYLQAIGHKVGFSKNENELQESELFFKSLIAESLDGIVLSNVDGVIDFASSSIEKILGYTSGEVVGKTLFDFTFPDDIALAERTFTEEVKKKQEVKFINIRLRKKSGELLWCIVRGHNMLENPYIGKIVIYFSDDTLRKKAEEALIESKNKLKEQATIVNNVTDVIVTTDLNRIITSWNSVIEKLTGITAQDAIGKRFRDVIDTNYAPYTHDQVADIVMQNGIWRGEISFVRNNGEKIFLLHTVSMLYVESGEKIGLLGVGKDITERKKIESRLQQSELFYRRLSYYSIDGIIMSDRSGTITYCGPSVERISGYEPAQLLGHHFFEFVHPDDIPAATDAFYKELNKESVLNYIFLRLKHSNGEWTWCTVRGHNLLSVPDLNTFIIYFTNDTRRKEAEDLLRRSEEKFRSLITNLQQGVILLDNNGVTVVCNQTAQDMLGLKEEEILGKTSLEYDLNVVGEDGKEYKGPRNPLGILLASRQSVKDVVIGVQKKDSVSKAWLLVNAEPVFVTDGSLANVVCSLTDITEQKRLAEELFQQEVQKQKLLVQAAIDVQETERQEIGKELHDNINQYLTTARLYLEVAKEKSTGEVQEMINLSHKTLSDIVKEIRKISQSLVPPTLGDIGLVESVQELIDSIKQAHTLDIEFQNRYFEEAVLNSNMKLTLFRIIQEQINNILKHSGAANVQVLLQSDAEFVTLSIADDGIGFDKGNYKKGRGLGNISSRASLVNGKMIIETAPGKGCTLSVSIPIS